MVRKREIETEKMEVHLLWPSFCFEVLEATTMLLYMLSGIEANRPRQPFASPGLSFPLPLPGLPELCFSPCIGGPSEDDLYGRTGAASRIAFKGWFLEVYDIWGNNYRPELRDLHGGVGGFLPQLGVLGDMRHIRNDVIHHRALATSHNTGKCEVLEWFKIGEEIIFEIRHVLDFLNQIGALIGQLQYDYRGNWHTLRIFHDRQSLLNCEPEPKPISVRTNRQPDGPYLHLHIVFSNGLYQIVPVGFEPIDGSLDRRRESLKLAKINCDGNIEFADGSVLEYRPIYVSGVNAMCDPIQREQNRGPVDGPWVQIGPEND